jgi:hypothetical protein
MIRVRTSQACARAAFSVWTVLALLACVAAIVVYAGVVYSRAATAALVWVQAASFAAVCGSFFACSQVTSKPIRCPYRHVFGFLAPAILVSLVLAPLFARLLLRPTRRPGSAGGIDGITQPTRAISSRRRLRRTELFVSREFPPRPHGSHVALRHDPRAHVPRPVAAACRRRCSRSSRRADWMLTLWGYASSSRCC